MIAPEILKKHNLKAVPFSCIGEGETFNIEADFSRRRTQKFTFYTSRLSKGRIVWADGHEHIWPTTADEYRDRTVYVPVDRVTSTIKGDMIE